MSKKGEFQANQQQYKMPDALKQEQQGVYRVGYNATTGNTANGETNLGKRSDLNQ
ncbi:hypothetical protein [Bacillus marasmi]|uniref:hypothetical protein n=1 Tax=Bacillus marasmi TaxID=1926279 RepID=UPI00164E0816|nr:hypothetical protein [Bacillus marasmi]